MSDDKDLSHIIMQLFLENMKKFCIDKMAEGSFECVLSAYEKGHFSNTDRINEMIEEILALEDV